MAPTALNTTPLQHCTSLHLTVLHCAWVTWIASTLVTRRKWILAGGPAGILAADSTEREEAAVAVAVVVEELLSFLPFLSFLAIPAAPAAPVAPVIWPTPALPLGASLGPALAPPGAVALKLGGNFNSAVVISYL